MTDNILYFAVFDGHGGPDAADFCDKYMEKFIKDLVTEEDNLELVLTKAFLEVDKALAKHLHFSPNGFEALDFPTDMTRAHLVRGLSFNPKLLND